MSKNPVQFVIDNAEQISVLTSAHGPRPPVLTGNGIQDRDQIGAWMASVAMLAAGHEPTAHNGSTYKTRKEASEKLTAAWNASVPEAVTGDRQLRHRTLPVTAPESMWTAMKWQVYSNSEVVGGRAFDVSGEADKLLAVAVTKGMTGADALAFVTEEIDRQREVSRLADAMKSEGHATSKLADALRAETEETVLSRIMSRLSEKTQYAVRQQLKG